MSMLDKVKGVIGGNKQKAKGGIDKAAAIADDKTASKHTDTIEAGAEKAKDAVDSIDDN